MPKLRFVKSLAYVKVAMFWIAVHLPRCFLVLLCRKVCLLPQDGLMTGSKEASCPSRHLLALIASNTDYSNSLTRHCRSGPCRIGLKHGIMTKNILNLCISRSNQCICSYFNCSILRYCRTWGILITETGQQLQILT